MEYNILLVEDNPHIMNINKITLLDAGYKVNTAASISEAREKTGRELPDILLLDVMLPDGDGISFCMELREKGIEVPILFLTAKGDKDDILEGFKAGGDDYLTKPYDLDILLARVQNLLKRVMLKTEKITDIKFGDIIVDLTSSRATKAGKDLLLTPKEFAILNKFWINNEEYITAEDLYKEVWGMNTLGNVSTVKERVFQLRKKIGENSKVQIENSRGKGYRLVVEKK